MSEFDFAVFALAMTVPWVLTALWCCRSRRRIRTLEDVNAAVMNDNDRLREALSGRRSPA